MPRTTTTFTVWVSSPGDTMREREVVRSVVDELNHSPVTRQLGLALEVKLWEDAVPLPSKSPQQMVNRASEESIADNDIFIGILKNRLGTPLPAKFGGGTGIEYEFEAALESYRVRGTPRILLYFGTAPTPIADESSLSQLRAVAAYKAKLSESSMVTTFASEHEFVEEVRRDLTRFLADWPASIQASRPTEAPTIFVSYSRHQSQLVTVLGQELAAAGFRAWYDTAELQGGVDWIETIASAIESSTVVVLLASSAAFASPWVRREVEFAVQMSKPVLPVQTEECQWPSWALLLFGGTQRVALDQQANNQQVVSIVKSISHLAASGHRAI